MSVHVGLHDTYRPCARVVVPRFDIPVRPSEFVALFSTCSFAFVLLQDFPVQGRIFDCSEAPPPRHNGRLPEGAVGRTCRCSHTLIQHRFKLRHDRMLESPQVTLGSDP